MAKTLAQFIMEKHGGKVDKNSTHLLAIDGVSGEYNKLFETVKLYYLKELHLEKVEGQSLLTFSNSEEKRIVFLDYIKGKRYRLLIDEYVIKQTLPTPIHKD